jgi:hypothetical protein
MAKLKFRGTVNVPGWNVEAKLSLLAFVEDDVTIVYSPELDLNGSGYTLNEAKASFYEGLSGFFRYTINKGTSASELKRLGWKIKGNKKNQKISSPAFAHMLKSNKEFEDIILNKDYTKFTEKVQMPEFA